ncbi:MAG: hypothetical protein SPLM_09650 [Spiroplasma phoeniceum]
MIKIEAFWELIKIFFLKILPTYFEILWMISPITIILFGITIFLTIIEIIKKIFY